MEILKLTKKEHGIIEVVLLDYIHKAWHKEIESCLDKNAHKELRSLFDNKIATHPVEVLNWRGK